MNFSLGSVWEKYIQDQVRKVYYNNASEVVRDALRLHEEHAIELERWRRELKEDIPKQQSASTSDQQSSTDKKEAS